MPALLRRFACVFTLLFAVCASAQQKSAPATLAGDMRELVETPAVSGYEEQVAAKIAAKLKAFAAKVDEQSNVVVSIGSGAPHRLIVAAMDEPGFVVSRITPDGYLQLQRLPQGGSLPLFNELYAAQPVKIGKAQGGWINGAVAGVNIHLFPQRQHPPSMADLDNMYVDVGAATAQQARAGGADVLGPLAIDRKFYEMANGRWASPAIGDRFGAAALVELVRALDRQKIKGTVTFAFVAQQWLGARGLQRVIDAQKPDEVIYVGRLMRPATGSFSQQPGSGVLIATEKPDAELTGLAADLKQLAAQNNISLTTGVSAPLLPRGGYMAQAKLPQRTVHLAVATAWPSTPAEFIDGHDLAGMIELLETYLQGSSTKIALASPAALAEPPLPKKPASAPSDETILKTLIETYGVSGGHEGNVTKAVAALLPSWAKTEVDNAGNLVLHWQGSAGSKAPSIAVVAHQDEIGYEVHAILPDGKLELELKGGGVLAYFMGHAALVHSANGMHPGVLELPDGWEKSDFQWPRGQRMTFRMDVGARNPQDVAQLGIKTGDYATIPKEYRKLLGTRASARAFDDRVGCAALVSAVWALGPNLNGRDVTFIWSTSEELGLEGAAAAAKNMAGAGHAPDYVFAIDTFVSADSPLESPRFADALIGQGFVVRAVDNSNIVPRKLAEKVVTMARAAKISAQYGVTGGGNDGAAFLLYGSTDVAMGWPLRYSHSPAEVIDVQDLSSLAKIIAAVTKGW